MSTEHTSHLWVISSSVCRRLYSVCSWLVVQSFSLSQPSHFLLVLLISDISLIWSKSTISPTGRRDRGCGRRRVILMNNKLEYIHITVLVFPCKLFINNTYKAVPGWGQPDMLGVHHQHEEHYYPQAKDDEARDKE